MDYKDFLTEWNDDSDVIRCHTSGSTGCPKIILLPKREMINSALRTVNFFSLDSESLFYSCVSPDYIGGKMQAVRAIVTGGTLMAENPSNRPLLNTQGRVIDLLAVSPSQMIHICDNKANYPAIKHIIVGGGKISQPIWDKICESGFDAWETYGMTETASHIALRKIETSPKGFHVLDGIKIEITQDHRLRIIIQNWQELIVNDIASIDSDGSFYLIGRADSVIVSGGKKIHPETVESILERILEDEVLITSKPDDKWGERVVLIIPESISQKYDDATIMQICKDNLPSESVPKEITHAEIPHTPNGKKERLKVF